MYVMPKYALSVEICIPPQQENSSLYGDLPYYFLCWNVMLPVIESQCFAQKIETAGANASLI